MDVASFAIDHDNLLRGIYLSRQDIVGAETVTTFDIRMKLPNREPFLGTAEIHTLEHLMAVYLRSGQSGWADRLIYIGPMGCRTGMYMVVKGSCRPQDVLEVLQDTFRYIAAFEGLIPAARSRECGNYLDHNLFLAKHEAKKYLDEVLLQMGPENMAYPQA